MSCGEPLRSSQSQTWVQGNFSVLRRATAVRPAVGSRQRKCCEKTRGSVFPLANDPAKSRTCVPFYRYGIPGLRLLNAQALHSTINDHLIIYYRKMLNDVDSPSIAARQTTPATRSLPVAWRAMPPGRTLDHRVARSIRLRCGRLMGRCGFLEQPVRLQFLEAPTAWWHAPLTNPGA